MTVPGDEVTLPPGRAPHRRGTPGYAAARRALSVSRHQPAVRPAAVARPADVDDVVALVRTARREGLRLAVRSGGHGLSAPHLRPDSLALDLRALHGVRVAPDGRTAWVGPATTVLEAAHALDAAGRAFPVGHAPTVGLGGYLLAGGNGWHAGAWGPACDRVVAVDVVTSDARRVRLTADADPELLAVVRGAGPAFPAVVVGMRLALVGHVPHVARRTVTVPGHDAADLGAALDALGPTLGPHVELTVFARAAGDDRAVLLLAATAFGTNDAAAATLLAPLATLGTGTLGPVVLHGRGLGALLDSLPRHAGDALASDHLWAPPTWAEVLPAAAATAATAPSPRSSVLVTPAPLRSAPHGPALYDPPVALGVSTYAHWRPGVTAEGGPAANLAWARGVELPAAGRYVGEADLTVPGRVAECFDASALDRLRAARDELDPDQRVWSALDA